MSLEVSVVVGNPRPNSRTLRAAMSFVEKLFDGAADRANIVDLSDHLDQVFAWPSDSMDRVTQAVAASDVVVFATPTYKATYTALLKGFLDRYPANGLAGIIAIPLHTGAGPEHSMSSTFTLAPILIELGAAVPGRGLYFLVDDQDLLDEAIEDGARQYAENFQRISQVAALLPTY